MLSIRSNNKSILAFLIVTLLFISTHAHATIYHNTLLKGRIGYKDIKADTFKGSKGSDAKQKINEGPSTEVALTKFITRNIAGEIGVGYSFIQTKGNPNTDTSGNTTKKRDSNIIPLNAFLQLHIPVQSFKPYFGIGYLYRIIKNTDANFKIKRAGGLAYQGGVDFFLFDYLGFNLDVKYAKIKQKIVDREERFNSKISTLTTMVGVVLSF